MLDAAGLRHLGGRHQSARRSRPRGPLPFRFNRHVIRPDDPDACWGWSAALFESGYPAIAAEPPDRSMLLGHRVSYELHIGPIPIGMCVLHRCDVRSCSNPRHLFLGTRSGNHEHMVAKRRHRHHWFHREYAYVSDREALEPRLHSERGIAQTPPKGMTSSYNEMNTSSMVFELQGTVHEIKQSIASLAALVERGFGRIEGLETSSTEIKEILRALPPKLEDLAGFTRHQAPQLADRTDITGLGGNLKAEIVRVETHLKAEIDKRPTRYQSFRETAIVVVLVGVFLAIVSYLAH